MNRISKWRALVVTEGSVANAIMFTPPPDSITTAGSVLSRT
jgi:hypothetical protein